MEPVEGIPVARGQLVAQDLARYALRQARQEVIDEVNRVLIDENIKFRIDDEGYVDIDPT